MSKLLSKKSIAVDFENFTDFFIPPPWDQNMNIVHKLDKEVFDTLQIKKYRAVIAGGAALSWYQNQNVGSRDIDIWFSNLEDQKKMSEDLTSKHYRKTFDSDNAETFNISFKGSQIWRVQLIKKEYADVKSLLDHFDITVARIATDGDTWWLGKEFMEDFKNRRLVFTKTNNASVKRLIKYWTYGFQPTDDVLQMIINSPETAWDFTINNDEEYANAI